jgi:hypothetical protein
MWEGKIMMKTNSGAQPGNQSAKAGRAWEDLMPTAISQVTGLRLEHFGAPVRVLGVGQTKAGRRAPLVAFEGPAPLDWCGHYHSRHVEIDCKRMTTDAPSWSWASSMSPDQVERCIAMSADGCLIGICLLIDAGFRCYGIPWQYIAAVRSRGRASVKIEELDRAAELDEVVNLRPDGGPIRLLPFLTRMVRVTGDGRTDNA